MCNGRGRYSYMMRIYADKNIHIALVLVAGHGVKPVALLKTFHL